MDTSQRSIWNMCIIAAENMKKSVLVFTLKVMDSVFIVKFYAHSMQLYDVVSVHKKPWETIWKFPKGYLFPGFIFPVNNNTSCVFF